jgi:hypothetical protein
VSGKVSQNADRALLFIYVIERGFAELPQRFGQDEAARMVNVFSEISGLSEFDALAAFAELEDADMTHRKF